MKIEEIKARLKERRISRAELGAKLGVSKASVDNWLCGSRPIPHAKLQLIEMLLSPAPAPPPPPRAFDLDAVKVLVVRMTAEERALCVEAARLEGKEFEEWARGVLLDAAAVEGKKGGASSGVS